MVLTLKAANHSFRLVSSNKTRASASTSTAPPIPGSNTTPSSTMGMVQNYCRASSLQARLRLISSGNVITNNGAEQVWVSPFFDAGNLLQGKRNRRCRARGQQSRHQGSHTLNTETAGRFTLLRKLPAGGMGRVFEAEDPTSGRRVALKLIDLGLDADSVQIVNAERLGAELQKQLGAIDKRVTAIYETGEMPNYFYIVMEYVEGQDVSEIATGKGLPPDFAARIAQDVLEVLDHAHHLTTTVEGRPARGIVHGDLKPRNIRSHSKR